MSHPALDDAPAGPCAERLARLAATLREAGTDLALILQHVDLYYLAGTVPQGVLALAAGGDYRLGVWRGLGRARRESPLPAERLRPLRSLRELPGLLAELGAPAPAVVGLELDVIPMALGASLQRAFPSARVVDVSAPLRRQRAVKDAGEIAALRRAAAALGEVFEAADGLIAPGRTELEVAADVEREMRLRGHQGLVRMRRFNAELYYGALGTGRSTGAEQAFDGPVGVAGLYAAVPQLCARHGIRPGDTFMLDLVFGHAGYHVDAARLYSLGPPSPRVQAAHALALAIQARTAERLVPGATPSALYAAAVAEAEAAGLGAGFMGAGGNQVRFVGHGVGLEVDELPVLAPGFDAPIQAGMTVALEPKFFFGEEEAAGVENTFLVREGGPAEPLVTTDDAIRVL